MPAERAKLIAGAAQDGLRLIGLDASAAPKDVIEKLDAFVDAVQHSEQSLPEGTDRDDLQYSCGGLWGEQMVRQFGWEWATITFHQHGDSKAPGVVSPDRAMAIYPIHFLTGCFRNPAVDCTMALAFNMLLAGKAKGFDAKSYTNVMERVGRIVPRR